MTKKLLSILMSVLLLCAMLPLGAIPVFAATFGTTGDCTWTLDDTHLTISGNGAMADYDYYSDPAPWGAAITSVTIEDGVTAIGEDAFFYCFSLASVTIPDSVTSIGDHAFYFAALTSVTIPNSVITVGEEAFYGCSSLISATIGDSVTSIDNDAFWLCTSLTSIDVDTNNPYLSSLDGVVFNKEQTTLICYPAGKPGAYTIPDSVTSVDYSAFYYCVSLTSVTIPNSVTSIKSDAFFHCSSLISVTIPDSVIAIYSCAFDFCNNLTDVYYGGNEENKANISIGSYNDPLLNATWHYAKSDEPEVPDGLLYDIANGEVTITGYTEELPADLVIPDTIEGYPVTKIGYRAFYYCSSLTSVTIPHSVTTIGDDAFDNCLSLTFIKVDAGNPNYSSLDGVLFNKEQATLICYPAGKSGAYTIPDSVTTIGYHAFFHCSFLTSVTIPDSVTVIDGWAFSNCSSLTSIAIPDSVTTIGYHAFFLCRSLTSIDVDANNPNYSSLEGVFFNKEQTVLIQYPSKKNGAYTIPNSVTTIGEYAFFGCNALTTVNISNSITSISDHAFDGCISLTTVNFPNSITSIGSFAFVNCASLTTVNFPNSITSIGNYAFDNCTSLTTVNISNSITSISDHAFDDCTSLTNVYYNGSETNRANITIESNNTYLLNATWHYATDPISTTVTHSVMDTDNGSGLAFRFELSANGVAMKNGTKVDLSDATVNYLGQDCKLIGMGAVITNNEDIANSNLTIEQSNGQRVIDIPVVYLQEATDTSCAFAIRLINIPDSALECTIYARPYYIVEVGGEEIVVYGDVDSASCAQYM